MTKYPDIDVGSFKEELENYKNNSLHPFYGYFGNDAAIEVALDIVYSSFVKDRICKSRIALTAPASAGKTEFARRFAKLLGNPFVVVDGSSIKSVSEIISSCKNQWNSNEWVKLQKKEEWQNNENKTILPSMCLFIDEIHRTAGKVQDQMLKFLESKDGVLIDRHGNFFDFQNVCVMIATNDPGKLREAFKTRFTFININKPTKENVIKILKASFEYLDDACCHKIASLTHTVRQALDFANLVYMSTVRSNKGVIESVELVRKRSGIYSNGLTERALLVLKAIASTEGGCSRKGILAMIPDMEEIEFEEIILPQLISAEKNHLISIKYRHTITDAGLKVIEECEKENS